MYNTRDTKYSLSGSNAQYRYNACKLEECTTGRQCTQLGRPEHVVRWSGSQLPSVQGERLTMLQKEKTLLTEEDIAATVSGRESPFWRV